LRVFEQAGEYVRKNCSKKTLPVSYLQCYTVKTLTMRDFAGITN